MSFEKDLTGIMEGFSLLNQKSVEKDKVKKESVDEKKLIWTEELTGEFAEEAEKAAGVKVYAVKFKVDAAEWSGNESVVEEEMEIEENPNRNGVIKIIVDMGYFEGLLEELEEYLPTLGLHVKQDPMAAEIDKAKLIVSSTPVKPEPMQPDQGYMEAIKKLEEGSPIKESYGNYHITADLKRGISEEEVIKNIKDRYSDISDAQAKEILAGAKSGKGGGWDHRKGNESIDETLWTGEINEEDRAALVAQAVKFLSNPEIKGTAQMKMAFVKNKGLTDTEALEALNQATGGELVKSALGEGKKEDAETAAKGRSAEEKKQKESALGEDISGVSDQDKLKGFPDQDKFFHAWKGYPDKDDGSDKYPYRHKSKGKYPYTGENESVDESKKEDAEKAEAETAAKGRATAEMKSILRAIHKAVSVDAIETALDRLSKSSIKHDLADGKIALIKGEAERKEKKLKAAEEAEKVEETAPETPEVESPFTENQETEVEEA